ncbi:hypothetical protein [Nocardia sp. NPDC024068]|uniref:hypothetical protein n=1 Tax=Nocardia sp. NPDC024068 TaxID=3157197 RepID=UPI0033BFF468
MSAVIVSARPVASFAISSSTSAVVKASLRSVVARSRAAFPAWLSKKSRELSIFFDAESASRSRVCELSVIFAAAFDT